MDKRRSTALGLLAALVLVAKRRKKRLALKKKPKSSPQVSQQSSIVPLKCGEIFVLHPASPLKLKCTFCEDSYDDLAEFGHHIRGKHLQSHTNESDTNMTAFGHHIQERNPLEDAEITYESLDDEYAQEFSDEESTMILDIKTENEECVAFDLQQIDYGDSSTDKTAQNTNAMGLKVESFDEHEPPQVQEDENKTHEELLCKVCNCKFADTEAYTRHINLEHNSKVKCRYCFLIFKCQNDLNEHEKTHDPERPFACNLCQITFKSRWGRDLHIRIVHLNQSPYKCRQCPKEFRSDERLRFHMREHKMSFFYECKICGRKCPYKSRLKLHMRKHTGEKPFQCEVCGLKFVRRNPLTEHMKRHNNVKNFECATCGKKFFSNESLKCHRTSHTGERPYKCEECGKAFGRRNTLKAHRLLHSDVKKYSCDICGKQFTQYAGLSSHRKCH